MGGDALEQVGQVRLGELPLDRSGDLLVVIPEGQQPCFCLIEAAEVVCAAWLSEAGARLR